jgi:hypothetical protein
MQRHALKLLSAFSLLALTLTVSVPKVHAQLVNLDYPNAFETDANDVNNNGVIVGFYVDTSGVDHGFTRINGNLSSVDVPGSIGTLLYGVSLSHAVGWYTDSSGVTHGFSVTPAGKVTTIDPPGTTMTDAWSINSSGTVVGAYTDSSGVYHGFILSNGKYTSFDAPGGSILTEITGINDEGAITGIFDDSTGVEHGFVQYKGKFNQIDYPINGVAATATDRINASGEIVGLYGTSTSGPFSGYQAKNGVFTTITFPGSFETRTRGLNDKGVVVGRYTDQSGVIHGYYGVP